MQSKHVIGAAGFFGLGALVAWAVTADKFEEKVRKAYVEGYVTADAAASMHFYQDSVEDLNQPQLPFEEAQDEDINFNDVSFLAPSDTVIDDGAEVHVVEPDDGDEAVLAEEEIEPVTRENLQNIIDKYTSDPRDREEFVQRSVRSLDPETAPFVISRAKYAWDEEEGDSYAKVTLTYYPKQRVLLDEDEDVIEDVDGYVGWRALSNFGGESEDPDVVFVRNRRLTTDFEVVRDEENELPLHVKYGMPKDEFRVSKAAGTLKVRREDE